MTDLEPEVINGLLSAISWAGLHPYATWADVLHFWHRSGHRSKWENNRGLPACLR